MKKDDLNDRLFSFAVLGGGISLQENIANSVIIFIKSKRNKNDSIQPPELLKLLPQLPKTPEFNIIRYQLAKAQHLQVLIIHPVKYENKLYHIRFKK